MTTETKEQPADAPARQINARETVSATRPLFILTTPRSLASQLCAMIGNHPQMIGLAETNLFSADTYAELERRYLIDARFQHGLLRSIAEIGLGSQTPDDIEAAKAWLESNRSFTSAQLFEDLRSWAAPRRLVETSLVYVYRPGGLARIREAYPDADFLYVSQHPRTTCESIYRTRKAAAAANVRMLVGANADLTPETMWLEPHLRIQEELKEISGERKRFLRSESLMEQPEHFLDCIAKWLGISNSPDAIDAMMHPEEAPFSSYGPDNAPLGNDPQFLENPRLKPYQHEEGDLDSPMSWDAAVFFSDEIRQIAGTLGY